MRKLSVVIPAYNEEDNVSAACSEVGKILSDNQIDYEIIFVDDGSGDLTWERLTQLCTKDANVKALRFSRNFGKEAAIFAGLKESVGDAVIVMDCDLQHPPETIIKMYNIWANNDIDIVEARKSSRGKESLLYKFFARVFYGILKFASGMDLNGASDFKLLDRKVVDALNEMPERLTFFRALSSWVGFRSEYVYFDVAKRKNGKTKWSFMKLARLAVSSVTSFSNFPMHIITGCGLLFFFFSVIMGVNTLYNYLSGKALEGFSTVILLILITGSIIMLGLGIIGYYLSKIYEEIKYRPRFIISERTSKKEDSGRESC